MTRCGIYDAIGHTTGCRHLAERLYSRIDRDPLLRPFFPGKTHTCAIEEFSAFLVQLLGGPPEDAKRRWWLSLHESHLRFKIGKAERDAWMKNMSRALEETPMDESTRGALRDFFLGASAYLVNQGTRPHMSNRPRHTPLAEAWERQRALDEAVAVLRAGDTEGGIARADSLQLDASVRAGLLALMLCMHNAALLDYVHRQLDHDNALAQARYNGRTLLHAAAAAGSLATVELLLRKGVDPNAADGGSHTPLYSVANECSIAGGAAIVRALVERGAKVDSCDGVKHCTPLHMAARRGNVEVAGALLDCGADLEARDSLLETPLRRAVNCSKVEVAALLVSRGADVNSRGSKGLTPLLAARTEAMRRTLRRDRSPSQLLG